MTTNLVERPQERREFIPPERSLAQRREALRLANLVRERRAKLKIELKARRKNGVAVLADPPAWLETMKVIDLVLAMPKYGRVKANKVLNFTQISPSKTVGGLSERQRRALVAILDYREEDGQGMVGALRSGVVAGGRGSRPGDGELEA